MDSLPEMDGTALIYMLDVGESVCFDLSLSLSLSLSLCVCVCVCLCVCGDNPFYTFDLKNYINFMLAGSRPDSPMGDA